MAEFIETPGSNASRLEITGMLAGVDPDAVFRALTESARTTRWWSEEAEVDARVGGSLIARWPQVGWTFRGTYRELEPGRSVAFTWSWDHEPHTPPRLVRITLAPDADGTRLTLQHGEYGAGDAAERQGHLEGWQHFLPRLADAAR